MDLNSPKNAPKAGEAIDKGRDLEGYGSHGRVGGSGAPKELENFGAEGAGPEGYHDCHPVQHGKADFAPKSSAHMPGEDLNSRPAETTDGAEHESY